MKQFILSILILTVGLGITNAQEKFEFGVTANAGYYFPKNEDVMGRSELKNGFSPAIGTYLSCRLFKKTNMDVGLGYKLLLTEAYAYSDLHPAVTWYYLNVPLEIRHNFGEKLFAVTGISVLTNLQKVPNDGTKTEMNWKIGAGFHVKKGRISVQFERGFNDITKYAKMENSPNYLLSQVKHQEIYIKLAYPLWKF